MSKENIKITTDKLIGKSTDISGLSKETFEELAFDLYKETAMISVAVSNLVPQNGKVPLLRNQAIKIGLLIRIAKFMSSVLSLACDKVKEHGEVVIALNRCIIESSVYLVFFCEKATLQDFDDFVKSSLKPERDLHNTINTNIANRGETLPIETRMLASISRVLKSSGIKNVEELGTLPKPMNYKKILSVLGLESMYSAIQGVPSHSIHGTWMDLIMHHLKAVDKGFEPNSDSANLDARLLCPVNGMVLKSIKAYLAGYSADFHSDVQVLINRIDDLVKKNYIVDTFHEDLLSK